MDRTRGGRWALTLLLGVAIGAALAPPAQAGPRSMTIVTRDFTVSRIGPFQASRDGRLSAAIRAFGRPSSRVSTSRVSCRVDWRRLRLRIYFANFGGVPSGKSVCSSSVGKAQTFVARGSRFRARNGVRVGDRSSSIRRKHPGARYRRGSWGLVFAVSPFGDGSPSPVLSARVSGGRVRALVGYIGAAGE